MTTMKVTGRIRRSKNFRSATSICWVKMQTSRKSCKRATMMQFTKRIRCCNWRLKTCISYRKRTMTWEKIYKGSKQSLMTLKSKKWQKKTRISGEEMDSFWSRKRRLIEKWRLWRIRCKSLWCLLKDNHLTNSSIWPTLVWAWCVLRRLQEHLVARRICCLMTRIWWMPKQLSTENSTSF